MSTQPLTSTANPIQGNLHYYYLPKGIIHLEIITSAEGVSVASKLELIADPDHRYFLKYSGNAFSSDTIDIEFTENGFLRKVGTTIEDQTVKIAEKVITLAETAAQLGAGPTTRSLGPDKQPVKVFSGPIDPFDEEEMTAVNKVLGEHGFKVALESLGKKKEAEERVDAQKVQGRFGIFCRPKETFKWVVSVGDESQTELMTLPNGKMLHFIEIPNASFVKNSFEISCDDFGYPVKIHLEKPSQALAIIEVPIKILQAIISIPSKLFSFRINYNNEKKRALEEELAFDKFRQQYEKDKEVLEKNREIKQEETEKKISKQEETIAELQERLIAQKPE
ncbi:MAG: hypothetical protein AAF824_05395 [Bacteroidota bacterium]